jgi:hypothetical protein
MVKRGALSLDEIGSSQAFVDIVVVHRSSHIPQSSQIITSPTPAPSGRPCLDITVPVAIGSFRRSTAYRVWMERRARNTTYQDTLTQRCGLLAENVLLGRR